MGVHETEKYAQVKELLGIPEDEPIFILRGQDKTVLATIRFYQQVNEERPNDPSWLQNLYGHREKFEQFAHNHPDRMKFAD